MCKICLVSLFFMWLSLPATCQHSIFWGGLESGPFNVGYQDTTLFNADQPYEFGDYQGAKPVFISMWFPIQSDEGAKLKYSDYFHLDQNDDISQLIDSMKAFQAESFFYYGILKNLDTWDPDPETPEKSALYQAILHEDVSAKWAAVPRSKFPTIIYHHGSESLASDNFVLCEYLASQGFVVVSAQYQLAQSYVSRLYAQEPLSTGGCQIRH